MLRISLLAFLLAMPIGGPDLFACSALLFVRHVVDEAEKKVDHNPPARPELEVLRIVRGSGPVVHGDLITINTCAKYGLIELGFVTPPSDDRTSVDELGVSWRIVSGKPPDGLREPRDFERIAPARLVDIGWDDGGTDTQEAFDFEIVVIVRDRAGNESSSDPLRITDEGRH